MAPVISAMSDTDAGAVALLSGQLGYPIEPEPLLRNLKALRAEGGHEVLVARLSADGPAVGWIHIHRHLSLASGPRCEVAGLVVDEKHRGVGIGSALLAAAERWAAEHGLMRVHFTSRITRSEAHRLYERLGYRIEKTSHVFDKRLKKELS